VQGEGETAHAGARSRRVAAGGPEGYHPEVNAQEGRAGIPIWLLSILVVALLLLALWAGQRRLMYFPFGDTPAPDALGLDGVEAVTFETADGLRLDGWFFPAGEGAARATVLVFNGNAGNRSYRVPLATGLRDQGFQVLLFDYRGFGGNPGTPTEGGLALDARAARDFLVRRNDVDASRLIYFGESLGSAVAAELAAEHPPAALVLRSPFTSMTDVGQHHYWWLPVRWLIQDRYATIDLIGRVRSPLLVIVGERDRIVPTEFSRRLYEAANEPRTILSMPDADHNDYELLAGEEMIEGIVRFLGR
jgi:fermentation-respiration switch protein FrsA (DUF1100 family)